MSKWTFVLVLLLGLQGQPGASFEVGIWPGEGRPVIGAAASRVSLREFASGTSRTVFTLDVQPGQRMAFDDTKYVTSKPGRLRALRSATVSGRLLGNTTSLSRDDYYSGRFRLGSVSLAAGSDIEYLQDRAEGTCFVRVNGDAIDADPCPTLDSTSFGIEAAPIVEWWVHIVAAAGPAGWAQVTDSTVKVIDREF